MIGALNKRVTFSKTEKVSNGRGGWTNGAPVTIGQRWANVQQLNAREVVRYMQADSEINTRIIVRSDSLTRTLTNQATAAINGRTLDIKQVAPLKENEKYIEIMAVEVDPQGVL